jgi:uncharacterized protein YcfJ
MVLFGALLVGSLGFFSGCTKQEKTVSGVAIGAGSGALIGSAISHGAGGPIVGAIAGGALGGILGNAAGDDYVGNDKY